MPRHAASFEYTFKNGQKAKFTLSGLWHQDPNGQDFHETDPLSLEEIGFNEFVTEDMIRTEFNHIVAYAEEHGSWEEE